MHSLFKSRVFEANVEGAMSEEGVVEHVNVLQEPQHTLDGRTVDVKAAMPKSRGGSKEKGLKMFVGGVPVSLKIPYVQ